MFPSGHGLVARSRLYGTARVRRALVYLLAAVLAVTSALLGVRLAFPPDPYGPVRVERLPGASSEQGEATTKVSYDPETECTVISRREPDGTVRRYQVTKSDGQWRIEPRPETPP